MASWEVFSVAVRLHLFVTTNLLLLLLDVCFCQVINKKLFYYYHHYFFSLFWQVGTNYSKEPKSVTAVN